MNSLPISIQLYTLRDQIGQDFPGTLKKVAAMGYKYVELVGGFGNLKDASELRTALDDAGLKPSGRHVGMDLMKNDMAKVLDDCQTLGVPTVICPWLPDERRTSMDVWKKNASEINGYGKACVARGGLDFAYHNHDFEFKKFDGKTAMEMFWESTEPDIVKSELDVYWVKYAGLDPVVYMNQLGRRVILVHLKDMASGPDKKFAPVGTGILDFKAICAAAANLGVKFGIVEQDDCYGMDPLEAIKISLENLKKMGLA